MFLLIAQAYRPKWHLLNVLNNEHPGTAQILDSSHSTFPVSRGFVESCACSAASSSLSFCMSAESLSPPARCTSLSAAAWMWSSSSFPSSPAALVHSLSVSPGQPCDMHGHLLTAIALKAFFSSGHQFWGVSCRPPHQRASCCRDYMCSTQSMSCWRKPNDASA